MNTRALKKAIFSVMTISACMTMSTLWAESQTAHPAASGLDRCIMSVSHNMFPAEAVTQVLTDFGIQVEKHKEILAELEFASEDVDSRVFAYAAQTDPNPLAAPVHGPLVVKIRKQVAEEIFHETMLRHGWRDRDAATQMAEEISELRNKMLDQCLQAMR